MKKITERRLYFFTCTLCGKKKRQSFRKAKASDGVCGRCKREAVDPNQAKLF